MGDAQLVRREVRLYLPHDIAIERARHARSHSLSGRVSDAPPPVLPVSDRGIVLSASSQAPPAACMPACFTASASTARLARFGIRQTQASSAPAAILGDIEGEQSGHMAGPTSTAVELCVHQPGKASLEKPPGPTSRKRTRLDGPAPQSQPSPHTRRPFRHDAALANGVAFDADAVCEGGPTALPAVDSGSTECAAKSVATEASTLLICRPISGFGEDEN